MARPRLKITLFAQQLAALQSDAFELLVGTSSAVEEPVGASFLLRAAAIHAASATDGARILILRRNDGDVRRDHIAGVTGLDALTREMQATGFAEFAGSELTFSNGSTIFWSGCAREAEVARLREERIDVLLADRVEEIPEGLYAQLRQGVRGSARPRRRIIATTRSADQGWVGQHWGLGQLSAIPTARFVHMADGNGGKRHFLPLSPKDLDAHLIVRPEVPTYRAWIERLHGGSWTWAPHVEAIVRGINRWVRDDFEHLAIFVPSQHGKTTAGPRNAIPYVLSLHPSDWCSVASYDSNLAHDRSADARENYARAGGMLKSGRSKQREWQTIAGGGCWSAGTAAGQAGRSSTWSFIDDADRDWADAVNATQQQKKRRWYGSVYRARESMFAAEGRRQKVCITATRWDPEDLAGYALQQGAAAGEKWGLLVLSALHDPAIIAGYRAMYPAFEVLDDFREVKNEPLWPDRRTLEEWRSVFILRGPLIADCECQQNPRGAERGGIFQMSWFTRLDCDPAFISDEPNEKVFEAACRAWDLGGTEGAGDWTAGSKLGRMGGRSVVRHVVRAQFAPAGVRQLIAAMMILDGPTVTIRLPLDPAAGGIHAAETIIRYLREVAALVEMPCPRIVTERPARAGTATQSAKAARARSLQSRAQPPGQGIDGAVSYVGAPWRPAVSNLVKDYQAKAQKWPELAEIAKKAELAGGDWQTVWLREMEAFTGDDGRTDDQVDATVDADAQIFTTAKIMSGGAVRIPGWG